MEPRFDEGDVSAILGGVLDANRRLAAINADVRKIRILLEDGDEEEEEDAGDAER